MNLEEVIKRSIVIVDHLDEADFLLEALFEKVVDEGTSRRGGPLKSRFAKHYIDVNRALDIVHRKKPASTISSIETFSNAIPLILDTIRFYKSSCDGVITEYLHGITLNREEATECWIDLADHYCGGSNLPEQLIDGKIHANKAPAFYGLLIEKIVAVLSPEDLVKPYLHFDKKRVRYSLPLRMEDGLLLIDDRTIGEHQFTIADSPIIHLHAAIGALVSYPMHFKQVFDFLNECHRSYAVPIHSTMEVMPRIALSNYVRDVMWISIAIPIGRVFTSTLDEKYNEAWYALQYERYLKTVYYGNTDHSFVKTRNERYTLIAIAMMVDHESRGCTDMPPAVAAIRQIEDPLPIRIERFQAILSMIDKKNLVLRDIALYSF